VRKHQWQKRAAAHFDRSPLAHAGGQYIERLLSENLAVHFESVAQVQLAGASGRREAEVILGSKAVSSMRPTDWSMIADQNNGKKHPNSFNTMEESP
jgi:hypothetical protein